MESFINDCVIDVVNANAKIKDVLMGKYRYFYNYVFIYIHLVKSPPKNIVPLLFDVMKDVINIIDSSILDPTITIYQNYRNIMSSITRRFISNDFRDRLELFNIIHHERVQLWLEDELEDNKNNDEYLMYYMKFCKRMLPIEKVLLNMEPHFKKLFGIDMFSQSYIYDVIKNEGIDKFIDDLIERNRNHLRDVVIANEENTLFESIYSYPTIIILERNNHRYAITPPEFEFSIKSRKNIYTNEELSIDEVINMFILYSSLFPYLGTYRDNLNKYLDTSYDDSE